jgi:hypothetical protein
VTGASGAAPIWNAVMRRYHQDLPELWYERPPNVVNKNVCWPSGLLPSAYCQRQRSELFVAGTEPKLVDNIWQPFPPGGGQVYMILPPEAEDWVRTSGIAQPPRSDDGGAFVAFHPEVSITWPRPGSHVTGQIQVQGNARGEEFQSYRLQIGPGLEPGQWTDLGSGNAPVEGGALGYLNTWNLSEGLYTLRLLVQRGGGTRQWTTQITIDKTPPTVMISDPQPNRLYVMEQHEQININAVAQDTWALARVEFFRNGQRFAVSTVAPFNERWKIEMQNINVEGSGAQNWLAFESNNVDISPGRIRHLGDGFAAVLTGNGTYLESHVFKVRAYDRAGNMAESEEVRVYVRRRDGS